MLTPSIVVFLIKAPTKRTIQKPIAAMVKIIRNAKSAPDNKFGLIQIALIASIASVDMKSHIERHIHPVRRSKLQQQ